MAFPEQIHKSNARKNIFRRARLNFGIAMVKLDRSGRCRRTLSNTFARFGVNTPIMFFHSASMYDLKMNNLANFCGEDLLKIILGMERFVVDNNAEWKERSLKEPHRAFIIGRTIDSESHNLEGVFFNQKIRGGRKNVFLFGINSFKGHPLIEIDRMDVHFKSKFSGSLPTLDQITPAEQAQWNDPAKRLQLRDIVAELVRVFPSELLRAKIKEAVPLAFKDYEVSCNVATWAYALLLQEIGHKDKPEVEKFINNHENLFGDTELIQEALLFKAGILSQNTQHVWRMASYCGIQCEK
jgi:hypothetical protein